MKTLIFVTARLPFPTISGRKKSLYHYCRILHENLGYRVVVVSFLENGDDPSIKPPFIDRLEVLPASSIREKVIFSVVNSFIKKKWPMQVSLFWSPEAKNIIDKVIEEEKPVILISDMVRTVEYLRNIKCFKIADLDDMISIRYQRQLEQDINNINPYGAYIHILPNGIKNILVNNKIKRLVLKQEIQLLKKYELIAANEFDNTIFVAEQETAMINAKLESKKAVTVPIGVDFEYFSKKVINCNHENHICFLGQMSVAHNEYAVIYFIEQIFPLILADIPTVVFTIIGGGLTDRLKSYSAKNIIMTGKVDDVRPFLQQNQVFVCPLKFGSGIKTKVLEAMASGIPVVTTSIGAENIGARNGQEWFVEDIPSIMADKICRLLKFKELNKFIGINGQRYVKTNWTWDAAQSAFEKFLP